MHEACNPSSAGTHREVCMLQLAVDAGLNTHAHADSAGIAYVAWVCARGSCGSAVQHLDLSAVLHAASRGIMHCAATEQGAASQQCAAA